jgi:hypothetical protein
MRETTRQLPSYMFVFAVSCVLARLPSVPVPERNLRGAGMAVRTPEAELNAAHTIYPSSLFLPLPPMDGPPTEPRELLLMPRSAIGRRGNPPRRREATTKSIAGSEDRASERERETPLHPLHTLPYPPS